MGLKMRVGPRRIIPHAHLNTANMPLNQLAESHLCPGVAALDPVQRGVAVTFLRSSAARAKSTASSLHPAARRLFAICRLVLPKSMTVDGHNQPNDPVSELALKGTFLAGAIAGVDDRGACQSLRKTGLRGVPSLQLTRNPNPVKVENVFS
jgi:hypothetical protein